MNFLVDISFHSISPILVHVGGELKGGSASVDALTYYYKADQGIENYATYEVSVAAFTVAGDGPSETHLVGKYLSSCDEKFICSVFLQFPDDPSLSLTNEILKAPIFENEGENVRNGPYKG